MTLFARVAIGVLACASLALSGTDLWAQAPSNLAAASNGGHLVFFSSQFDDKTWRADHLIDGSANDGWAGQGDGAQAVVIAFAGNKLGEVEDVVINPYTREAPSNWAKEVEIQVSTTYPFRDFRSAGKLTLQKQGSDQVFSFPAPIQVRYLKIIFLSNHGGGYMEAGEVKAMGRTLPGAPPPPPYEEVAAAERGGRLESFSSEFNDSNWAAANLLLPDGVGQWAGKSAAAQEVVIALREETRVTDVAINNFAREAPANWAKEASVEVSTTAPYKGFQPLGKLSLPMIGDLHVLSLDAPVNATYVKVTFHRNHGGGYLEAARIRVFSRPTVGRAAPQRVSEQLETTGRAVSHEIHFAFNSAQILPDSEPVLDEIAELLRRNPTWELIIEGHTDNVGGAEFNLDLSRKRADAVKRWLVDQRGIKEVRLTTVGYGLTRPVADNGSESGRAQNRRVELARK